MKGLNVHFTTNATRIAMLPGSEERAIQEDPSLSDPVVSRQGFDERALLLVYSGIFEPALDPVIIWKKTKAAHTVLRIDTMLPSSSQ